MQSIVLKNFKSYEYQSLSNLNSRINVILGSNGQGKSNFFKAISFLFTDRFTINRAQFNGTLYRGAKTENPEILVQVNFSQKTQEEKSYKITKAWTNFTNEDFKINDKSRTRAEYENFIDSFGLSYTSSYNIVQQGKISQISQMSENELYLLLEDTAGVKRFMKKHEEAQNNLAKIETDLVEVDQNIKFLKDKVSQVEDKKNEYEFYSVEEKVRKIKKKRELINFMGSIQKTLKQMKQKHLDIIKELQQAKLSESNIKKEIDERQRNLKVLTEKAHFYERQNTEGIEDTINGYKKSLSAKKKDLKDVEKKIINQKKALQESEKKLTSLQKQLSTYREKYQVIKVDLDLQGESQDQKKVKQAYQAKIHTEKEAVKTIEEDLKKVNKLHSEFKMVNYSMETKELHNLEAQQAPIVEQMKKLRIQQIELGRNKVNLECEVQTILGRKKNLDETVRRILPMVDLRLQKLVEENKVQGVYGYLIEHLKIEKDVAFSYELAGLSKLCTLLVQNDQVAAKVIELNKKIHGKNINILPLSYLKPQAFEKRVYPKMENVFPLINEQWINVSNSPKFSAETKSLIQKVVNNTFAKYALVEDYSTALKVSKEYNLNCITGDRQIVYSDAYMCKVGREETYDKGKIEMFEALQNMNRDVQFHKNSLRSIEKKEVQLQNQEIEVTNQKEKLDLQITQLQKQIDHAKRVESTIQRLEAKRTDLQESIQRSNRIVQQYVAFLQNIQNNIKSKFKLEDLKKAESEYLAQKSKVQKVFSENYEKEKSLSNLLKEFESLTNEVANMQKKDFQSPDLQSKEQIIKDLDAQKRKLEEETTNLNNELTKVIEIHTKIKQKQVEMLAEITVEEENQKDVKDKLATLGDVNPEEEQEIEELSVSLSQKLHIDSINAKKRQFYTARDKVFFTKIIEYIEKVAQFSQSTKKIRQEREKLLEYIEKTEKQASRYMKSFVINFEKHFIQYFLKFVPNGKAELKTKIYTQKVKGITKNGYSLEIKVSFNEEEGIRKWSEFSGGQKTVLSLCIILAIQKCEPTPFCVFDEVDAALDPFYANKLVEIIAEESKSCQYFITSFKKSMLDFPETIANYYLVKSVNRVSNITLVEKIQAQNFVDELAE